MAKDHLKFGVAETPKRIIVGLSGASGAVICVRLLEQLKLCGIETHLVASKAGIQTLHYETDLTFSALKNLADVTHSIDDLAGPIASGSFRVQGMVVAPCSVRTLGEIAQGTGDNLLARAADVTLKERRRLVLMVRESPLSLGHIRNMAQVTEMGGIIAPPLPLFYAKPQDMGEMVDQIIGRLLDLFDLDTPASPRWGEA